MHAAFRRAGSGIELFVRLTPKASKDELKGSVALGGKTYIQARVRAVPEDNRANRALLELLAKELGLPKTTLSLASGHVARLKTVRIEGDPQDLEIRVEAWLEKRF